MRRFDLAFPFAIGVLALAGCPGGTGGETDTDDGTGEQDCDDGQDDDGDSLADCDDSDCRDDDDCSFTPFFLAAGGFFAYDAENDAIESATYAGEPQQPRIDILIANERYFLPENEGGGRDLDRCTITLEATDLSLLTLEAVGSHVGFVMPADAYTVVTDCETEGRKPINPGFAFGSSPQAIADDHVWGIGVGEFDPDTAAFIEDNNNGTTDPFVGGGFYWDAVTTAPDSYNPGGYGSPLGINGDNVVVTADGEPYTGGNVPLMWIDAETVIGATDTLPTGAYFVNTYSGYGFE